MNDIYIFLIKFFLITLITVGVLWVGRWYYLNKFKPGVSSTLIMVKERKFLAPGKQGLVVQVGGQHFFVILADKHTTVTELSSPELSRELQEDTPDATCD